MIRILSKLVTTCIISCIAINPELRKGIEGYGRHDGRFTGAVKHGGKRTQDDDLAECNNAASCFPCMSNYLDTLNMPVLQSRCQGSFVNQVTRT